MQVFLSFAHDKSKTFDRQKPTSNETFAEHLVPNINIHVATFYHAWSQWNIVNMALFEQNRLWLHLPGLKLSQLNRSKQGTTEVRVSDKEGRGQSLRSRGEVKNSEQQDEFAYLFGDWGVPFLTETY